LSDFETWLWQFECGLQWLAKHNVLYGIELCFIVMTKTGSWPNYNRTPLKGMG